MFFCSAGHAVADMFHLLSDSHPMAAREKTLRFGHTQMSLSRPSDDKSWAGFLFIFLNLKDSHTYGVFVNIAKLLLVCLLQQVEELFTDSQAWSVCQWRDPLSFWWQETNFTSAIERQDSKC